MTDRDRRFLRGYGIDSNLQGMAFGEKGPPYVWIAAMGEMLPRPDNRVVLDEQVKDVWGLPAARVDCTIGDNDRAMLVDMRAEIARVADAIGMEYGDESDPVKTFRPGASIHELGTARMGADRRTSYLDPHNRAWEVEHLYVVDGAAFATSAWQNPTLTMMALAVRAARHIIARGSPS